ncbi:magnesium transporter [Thiohalophilus sp.]|uniref:magnesium transporter n=1 Tax=Thiohalophilus sp. TaxID=3028392 RepID=UPI00397700AD
MQEEILKAVNELRQLDPEQRSEALLQFTPHQARVVFEQLEAPLQQEMLDWLPDALVDRLVADLDPDDRVRLLDTLPESVANRLLSRLDLREWRLTHKLLSYPEESAGRIMTPEYLSLLPSMTAKQAFGLIQRDGKSADTIDALPVLNRDGHLVGLVMLSTLVLAEPEQTVAALMLDQVPTADPLMDQEEVARLIQAADLLALPVVDEDGRLLGVITVDDAMDIIQLEHEEDFARAGASAPMGRPYFSISLFGLTRARFVWLLLLAIAGGLTVQVLEAFESLLEQAISLSLFIPLLIGVGGNSGAQSATTVTRAMALGDVIAGWTAELRVVLREAAVGFLLGTALGLAAYLPVLLVFDAALASTISITLVAICALATLVGSGMPLLARRAGIDPAVMSAPLVTTLVDACGLLLYFLIARLIMGL